MHKCKIKNCGFARESKRPFIYHIKNHHKISMEQYYNEYLNIIPEKCLFCNDNTSWNKRKNHYNETCSHKSCIAKHANKNSRESVKKKYGTTSVFSLDAIKKKTRETKKEKYGDENYNNPDANRKTCIERYGVDNGSKTLEVRRKLSRNYEKR